MNARDKRRKKKELRDIPNNNVLGSYQSAPRQEGTPPIPTSNSNIQALSLSNNNNVVNTIARGTSYGKTGANLNGEFNTELYGQIADKIGTSIEDITLQEATEYYNSGFKDTYRQIKGTPQEAEIGPRLMSYRTSQLYANDPITQFAPKTSVTANIKEGIANIKEIPNTIKSIPNNIKAGTTDIKSSVANAPKANLIAGAAIGAGIGDSLGRQSRDTNIEAATSVGGAAIGTAAGAIASKVPLLAPVAIGAIGALNAASKIGKDPNYNATQASAKATVDSTKDFLGGFKPTDNPLAIGTAVAGRALNTVNQAIGTGINAIADTIGNTFANVPEGTSLTKYQDNTLDYYNNREA